MTKLLNLLKNKYVIFSIQFLVATAITVAGFYYTPKLKHKYWLHQHITLIEDFIGLLTRYPERHLRYAGINNYIIRKDYKDQFDNRLIFHLDNNIEYVSGGYFLISPGSADYQSNKDDALVLSYVNLDMDRCLELATYDWTKLKTAKVIGIMASNRSAHLNYENIHNGCNGVAIPENYTIACTNGRDVSIPMSEEKALTACRCYSNYCSITFKLY